jgi:hypothetical protein
MDQRKLFILATILILCCCSSSATLLLYPVLFPEDGAAGPSASRGGGGAAGPSASGGGGGAAGPSASGGGGTELPEGRYVRIELPSGTYDEENILNLGELEVFDESDTNIALNTPVTGGPWGAHGGGPYENLTDGNYSNLAHTTGDGVPFMQVDLGGVHKIKKVVITNRSDCCKERAVDAKVIILAANGTTVVKETPAITTTAAKYTLTFPGNTWS